MLQWIYNNKTKLTGGLLVVLGSVQANSEALRAVLSQETFAWLTVALGCLVAALGFLNSHRPTI